MRLGGPHSQHCAGLPSSAPLLLLGGFFMVYCGNCGCRLESWVYRPKDCVLGLCNACALRYYNIRILGFTIEQVDLGEGERVLPSCIARYPTSQLTLNLF